MYINIYTHTHIYIIYIYIYIYTYIIQGRPRALIPPPLSLSLSLSLPLSRFVCICGYIYICTFIYLCVWGGGWVGWGSGWSWVAGVPARRPACDRALSHALDTLHPQRPRLSRARAPARPPDQGPEFEGLLFGAQG